MQWSTSHTLLYHRGLASRVTCHRRSCVRVSVCACRPQGRPGPAAKWCSYPVGFGGWLATRCPEHSDVARASVVLSIFRNRVRETPIHRVVGVSNARLKK